MRSLQEKQVRRVGTSNHIDVDVRIISATNENLEKAFEAGNFREDLYHRLNEFEIDLPPLRNRKEDIRLFAEHFIAEANALAAGEKYEGLLDDENSVPEEAAEDVAEETAEE